MKISTRKSIFAIIFSFLIGAFSQGFAELIAMLLINIKIPEFLCNIVNGGLYITFCYLGVKLLCKKYLKLEMKELNITKLKINYKWIIIGILLPTAIIIINILSRGQFVANDLSIWEMLSIITKGVFVYALSGGIVEELMFRGVMMNVLDKRFNRIIAILIPSLIFALSHIPNGNIDILSKILLIIAGTTVGIMFSLIADSEKTIWNSAIVHIIWNLFIIGGILSIGTEINENAIVNYVLDNKSMILTGGEFGIEASIIAVLGYVVVSVIAYYMGRKNEHSI